MVDGVREISSVLSEMEERESKGFGQRENLYLLAAVVIPLVRSGPLPKHY